MVPAVPAHHPKGHRVLPGHLPPHRLGDLQEHLRHPSLVQGVQHPAHAVIVQALRGDPRAQGVLGGLALEEVAKEVQGRGDEAQGVQDGGLEWRPSPPV